MSCIYLLFLVAISALKIYQNSQSKQFSLLMEIGTQHYPVEVYLSNSQNYTFLKCNQCQSVTCLKQLKFTYPLALSQSLKSPCPNQFCDQCIGSNCYSQNQRLFKDTFEFKNQTIDFIFGCQKEDLKPSISLIQNKDQPANILSSISKNYSVKFCQTEGKISFNFSYENQIPVQKDLKLKLGNIEINKKSIGQQEFIGQIDVQNPFIQLPLSLYYERQFLEQFNKECEKCASHYQFQDLICYINPLFDQMPTIKLNDLEIKPQNYLVKEERDIFCLSIKQNVEEDQIILGIPFLLEKTLIINGEDIFITQSKCEVIEKQREKSQLLQFYKPAIIFFSLFFFLMQGLCCIIAYQCDTYDSKYLLMQDRDNKKEKKKRIFELAQVQDEEIEFGDQDRIIGEHLKQFKIDLVSDLQEIDDSDQEQEIEQEQEQELMN